MKYIKLWESFDSGLIKIAAGPSHRAKGYTFVHANGWLGDEQIFGALSGPFWERESDGMGHLYYALPDNDPRVAYVMSVAFPEKFRRQNLSSPIFQKLADFLGREIRNPVEDRKLTAFTSTGKSSHFWENRRDLPFFPSSRSVEIGGSQS